MTRMVSDREWLVKIHYINHLAELGAKDAFLETVFNEIDTFYSSLCYLLLESGKIKTEVKHYNLPKISGTRTLLASIYISLGCMASFYNSVLKCSC